MVISGQLDLKLSCLFTDFFVYMDGHPQATVVHFPCSLVTQGFKQATMGITVCVLLCLFSCSTEHSKRGKCCIDGLSPWHMASVRLMHNLSKMMVIPFPAGDARLSWRSYKIYTKYRLYKVLNVPVL
jgi:hypothetical protein